MAAAGNSDFGYFGGGNSPSPVSVVDKLDYSNDTAVTKGPLSLNRLRPGATGSNSFGYFAGGYNHSPSAPKSTIDRVDYSNDTATASVRGPLPIANYYMAASSQERMDCHKLILHYHQQIHQSNHSQQHSLVTLLVVILEQT